MRIVLAIGLSLLLACTPRGAITFDPSAASVGQVTPVFIATTRQLEAGGFGPDRSEKLHFARYDISIPPRRNRGDINWPSRFEGPRPDRHFLTTKEELYASDAAFRADLAESREISRVAWQRRSPQARAKELFARLWEYWL